MRIRKFGPQDAPAVAGLVSGSFSKFVAPSFTKKGAREFMAGMAPKKQCERSKKRAIYVATERGKIIGMAEWNPPQRRISRLFVHSGKTGMGIGRALLSFLWKKHAKNGTMRVHSSIYAIPFYERMGFRKSGRRAKKNGFVFQPMVKKRP